MWSWYLYMLESRPCLPTRRTLKNFALFLGQERKRESLDLVTELDVIKLSITLKEVSQLLGYVDNLCDILHVFHTQGAFNFFFMTFFFFCLFSSLIPSKCTELTIVQDWLFLIPIHFNQFVSIFFYGSFPLLKWPSV